MSRAALKLGFQDAVDLVNFVTTQFPSYSPAWLVHVRCCGRSIAVSHESTELDGVSLALCYAREASFRGQMVRVGTPDPVTIAHETLHLFGASDKYGRSLAAFIPGWVTCHDIMRLDKRDLKDLKIDRLTASELGWVND